MAVPIWQQWPSEGYTPLSLTSAIPGYLRWVLIFPKNSALSQTRGFIVFQQPESKTECWTDQSTTEPVWKPRWKRRRSDSTLVVRGRPADPSYCVAEHTTKQTVECKEQLINKTSRSAFTKQLVRSSTSYEEDYMLHYQVEQGVGSCALGRLLISSCKWADICQVVKDDSRLTAPFSGPLVVIVRWHPHTEWLAQQDKLLHAAVKPTQTYISSLHLAPWGHMVDQWPQMITVSERGNSKIPLPNSRSKATTSVSLPIGWEHKPLLHHHP